MTTTDLLDLASSQHSILERSQLRAAGLQPHQIRHLCDRRLLCRLTLTTYRIGGAATTTESAAMSAVLREGAGAALGTVSALAWWGLPGFTVEPLHVVRPHGSGLGDHPSVTVHTSRLLPRHHLTEHRGIAVVTPARAIFDAAASLRPQRTEQVLEKAWARNLVSGAVLHAMFDELAQRGRPGIGVMRQLLTDRPPGYRPHESGLELRFSRLLADAGEAPMDRQVDVGGGCWIGRVDFIDRAARVIVEVQSLEFHGTPAERAADAARIAALEAAGWTVIEVTEQDLWFAPGEMLRRVAAARRAGRQRHRSV